MNRIILAAIAAGTTVVGANALHAQQVAGSTQLGIAVAELRDVTMGWSAKRQILGQTIYNDKNEKVGKVDDIIVAPDKAVSYAIVGAGGFLGVGKHDIAIPVNQFKAVDEKLVLAGASEGRAEGDAGVRIRTLKHRRRRPVRWSVVLSQSFLRFLECINRRKSHV